MKSLRPLTWSLMSLLSLTSLATACGPAMDEEEALELERKQSALLVDDIYSRLKGVEAQLPIFPATQTVNMGTFDVNSGNFQGMDFDYEVSPITHKPIKVPVSYSLNALAAVLRFDLQGYSANPITLTLGSRTVSVPAGSQSIQLNLDSDAGGSWTLRAGNVVHLGAILFNKKGVNGAGAFTLSALPIAIVYEPPQNLAKTNSAQMTISQQTSSVVSMSSSNDNSVKGASDWSAVTDAAASIDKIANAVQPGAGQLSTALKYVSSALGTVSTTVTQGTSVNSDHSLGLSTTNAVTVTTQLRKGPGLGDVFFFYRNPRIAWFMLNGQVSTTLLDSGTLVQTTGEQLKLDLAELDAGTKTPSQTATGIEAKTIRQLLAMNPSPLPLVWNGTQPRFVKEYSLSISGGSGFTQAVSHTLTTTDRSSTSKFTTTVKDAHAGWLSAIGIGVTESNETTSKITMSSSRSDSTAQTQTASISLSAAAGESYNVDIFFDRLFGTFRVMQPRRLPPCCIIGTKDGVLSP